jgi:hypothetical protein
MSVVGAMIALAALVLSSCGGSGAQQTAGSTQGQGKPSAATTRAPASAPKTSTALCQQPCAVHNGVVVTVTNVVYGASSGNDFETPEAGNVYVTMNVDMKNNSSQEANFNPTDFVLLDGKGIKHTTTVIDSCPLFEAINLTKGADSGPKCIAFEASANAPHGLALVWTPGLFSSDIDIKLT